MSGKEDHNLKKNLVEIQCLLRVCSSVPTFIREWTKTDRPDWCNSDSIGIEMTAVWPNDQRELYDYKSPIGKCLKEVRMTCYKLPFIGIIYTTNGGLLQYSSSNDSIIDENRQEIYLKNVDKKTLTDYESAICCGVSPENKNIGADVLDYIKLACDALDAKLDRLNQGGFTKYKTNILCISCPLFSDLRGRYVGKIMEAFVNIQSKAQYTTTFDEVYLSLDNAILIFNMHSESIYYYRPIEYKGKIYTKKVNDLLKNNIPFDLSDVSDPVEMVDNPFLEVDCNSEYPPDLLLTRCNSDNGVGNLSIDP